MYARRAKISSVASVARTFTRLRAKVDGTLWYLPLELDAVVEVDRRRLPLREGKALLRERPQRGAIEPLEELAATHAVAAHHAIVGSASSSRMRAFIDARVVWRSSPKHARTHRCAICTATSTLALSRGRAGRAGTTTVP